jgi:hypothetical protein
MKWSAHNKDFISVNTVFVAGFVFLVAFLGCSLITLSLINSEKSNQSLGDNSEQMQKDLLGLLNESTVQMMRVTNISVSKLAHLAVLQDSEYVSAKIKNHTSWTQFAVIQMANEWREGGFDAVDMDRSLDNLWKLFLNYPSSISMFWADQTFGNFLYVGNQKLMYVDEAFDNRVPYVIRVQNHTEIKCSFCRSTSDSYISDPLYAYQRNFSLSVAGPFNSRMRPWYLAAMKAHGEGAWTDVYPAAFRLSQGGVKAFLEMSAAKSVRAADGSMLGAVSMNVNLGVLSRFLQEAQSNLFNVLGKIAQVSSAQDISLLILDEKGRLVGTSTNDSIITFVGSTPKHAFWSDTIQTKSAKKGLEIISQFWGGNLSLLFARGNSEAFRVYPDDELFITSSPYRDDWGLKLISVSIISIGLYRGEIDEALSDTMAKIKEQSRSTTALLASNKAELEESLHRVQNLQIGLSVIIVVAGSAFALFFARKISSSLSAAASRTEDNSERLLRLMVADLRSALRITQTDGFYLSTERLPGSGRALGLIRKAYMDAAALLGMWKDFDVQHFDAFCVSVQGVVFGDAEADTSLMSLARRSFERQGCSSHSPDASNQRVLLREWMLEVCHSFDPFCSVCNYRPLLALAPSPILHPNSSLSFQL